MDIKFVELDAQKVGLADHWRTALEDAVFASIDMEEGRRKAGPITVTLKVTLTPAGDSLRYDVEHKVSAPARVVTKGGHAKLHNGVLLVADVEQSNLPFEGVINISPRTTGKE